MESSPDPPASQGSCVPASRPSSPSSTRSCRSDCLSRRPRRSHPPLRSRPLLLSRAQAPRAPNPPESSSSAPLSEPHIFGRNCRKFRKCRLRSGSIQSAKPASRALGSGGLPHYSCSALLHSTILFSAPLSHRIDRLIAAAAAASFPSVAPSPASEPASSLGQLFRPS